jgi:hypothetical protein
MAYGPTHEGQPHGHRRPLNINTVIVLMGLAIILAVVIAIMLWEPWKGGDPADNPASAYVPAPAIHAVNV